MTQKVALMILPPKTTKRLAKPLTGLGEKILDYLPGLKYDLKKTDINLSAKQYIAHALVNSFAFFALFLSLLLFLNYMKGTGALKSVIYSLIIFFIIFYILLKYPGIIAGKKAELVDKHLIFALKDLRLQIGSGVPFYNALVNVSEAGYGQASAEIEKAAKAINVGMPVGKALEKMALESKSEFLRRITWQLINTLRSGASLKTALDTIIMNLTLDQRDKIKRYAYELNLWVLVYMLFAVAIPTIGATLLVILSSFAGFSITKQFFITFIVLCFFIQIALIGFVKTRRPVVIL